MADHVYLPIQLMKHFIVSAEVLILTYLIEDDHSQCDYNFKNRILVEIVNIHSIIMFVK